MFFQKQKRFGPKGGSYNGFIGSVDEQIDLGHHFRKIGGSQILDCPFGCKGRGRILNPSSFEGRIDVLPDSNCQGRIENFKKFAFVSLCEGGEMKQLPQWSHGITLSSTSDTEEEQQQLRSILNVAAVSVKFLILLI